MCRCVYVCYHDNAPLHPRLDVPRKLQKIRLCVYMGGLCVCTRLCLLCVANVRTYVCVRADVMCERI